MDVDEAWMQMQAVSPSDIPGVDDLSDDMVHTWADDATPVFKREMWSHDANLGLDDVRTNNHLESYTMPHSTGVLEARTQTYTIWSNKQRDTDKTVMRLLAGDAPTEKTKAN